MSCALVIKGLTKTYKNSFTALKGIDLVVHQGDFFALLGPNGAGKSTTIGIVSSLVNKSSGSVEIFGHNLDRELEAAKACIGLVPQEFNFNIWEPTIEVVINQAGYYGIDRKTATVRAEKYLKQLGLWDKRHTMSRNLSGGMKRRLMIARALVHEPRLLILDEPTAGVDIEIRHSMWKFLKEINKQGTTIILTTHYLEEAESLCRNIAIIDQGEIIQDTSMKQLLNQLNAESFVLDLARPIDYSPQLAGHLIEIIDETTLEVCIDKETGMNKLFEDLSAHGIKVLSMRNKSNRLEQLFLSLVNQSSDEKSS
jgi:ABC-2 type transport system ATP-binding protein